MLCDKPLVGRNADGERTDYGCTLKPGHLGPCDWPEADMDVATWRQSWIEAWIEMHGARGGKDGPERQKAIALVLRVLSDPLLLVSPERADALELARKYHLTAEDLIRRMTAKARGA